MNIGVGWDYVDSFNEVFLNGEKNFVVFFKNLFFGYKNIFGVIFEGYEVMELVDDEVLIGRKSSGGFGILCKKL